MSSIFKRLTELLPFRIVSKKPPAPRDGKLLYTIFAGINGAGKTSLYAVLRGNPDLGERVNIDEIAMGMGSWRDTLIQIKAGRAAINQINDCIKRGVSFHQETTLPGSTIIKHIKLARDAGFRIKLYYVGVDSLEIAIERVHRRVEQGGHGIDDDIIRKRFEAIPEQLRELLPFCDDVVFYDNTIRFRQIAIISNGRLIDADRDLPAWFISLGLEPPSALPSEDTSDGEDTADTEA